MRMYNCTRCTCTCFLIDVIIKRGDTMEEKKKRNQYQFDKNKYDHVHLQLPKGRKDELKAHAEKRGESLNGFVNRAISDAVERDSHQKSAGKSIHIGSDAWESIKNAANSRGEKPSEYVIRVISEALERDQ